MKSNNCQSHQFKFSNKPIFMHMCGSMFNAVHQLIQIDRQLSNAVMIDKVIGEFIFRCQFLLFFSLTDCHMCKCVQFYSIKFMIDVHVLLVCAAKDQKINLNFIRFCLIFVFYFFFFLLFPILKHDSFHANLISPQNNISFDEFIQFDFEINFCVKCNNVSLFLLFFCCCIQIHHKCNIFGSVY